MAKSERKTEKLNKTGTHYRKNWTHTHPDAHPHTHTHTPRTRTQRERERRINSRTDIRTDSLTYGKTETETYGQ